jgi:hypothetical protein
MRGKAVISLTTGLEDTEKVTVSADGHSMTTAGEAFARAFAAKDATALRTVLSDAIDFQGLTPGRLFQASTGAAVAAEIILGTWLARAHVDELCSVTAGQVAGREHVAYRIRVHRDGDEYLIEQQAYFDTGTDGRIHWMRVLCSGYQPLTPA